MFWDVRAGLLEQWLHFIETKFLPIPGAWLSCCDNWRGGPILLLTHLPDYCFGCCEETYSQFHVGKLCTHILDGVNILPRNSLLSENSSIIAVIGHSQQSRSWTFYMFARLGSGISKTDISEIVQNGSSGQVLGCFFSFVPYPSYFYKVISFFWLFCHAAK